MFLGIQGVCFLVTQSILILSSLSRAGFKGYSKYSSYLLLVKHKDFYKIFK